MLVLFLALSLWSAVVLSVQPCEQGDTICYPQVLYGPTIYINGSFATIIAGVGNLAQNACVTFWSNNTQPATPICTIVLKPGDQIFDMALSDKNGVMLTSSLGCQIYYLFTIIQGVIYFELKSTFCVEFYTNCTISPNGNSVAFFYPDKRTMILYSIHDFSWQHSQKFYFPEKTKIVAFDLTDDKLVVGHLGRNSTWCTACVYTYIKHPGILYFLM
jgi:hypothetical protein